MSGSSNDITTYDTSHDTSHETSKKHIKVPKMKTKKGKCTSASSVSESRVSESSATAKTEATDTDANIVNIIIDVKNDMHKIVRVVNILEKKATANSLKTEELNKEVDIIKKDFNNLMDNLQPNNSHSESKIKTQTKTKGKSKNESIIKSLNDSLRAVSSYTEETEDTPQVVPKVCVDTEDNSDMRKEFNAFKNDIYNIINRMAEKIDSHISGSRDGINALALTSIALTKNTMKV
jgi:hypothetical protein